jgi:hypothetical protein
MKNRFKSPLGLSFSVLDIFIPYLFRSFSCVSGPLPIRIERLTRLNFAPFFEEELIQKGFLEVVQCVSDAPNIDMALRFPTDDLFAGAEGADVWLAFLSFLPFDSCFVLYLRVHG